jgi:hypothetical protein
MQTIITLSTLGLALALSGAAFANPVNGSALLERTGYANERMQIYRMHKRIYKHDQKPSGGTGRLQDRRDRPALGTVPPEVRKPAVRPESAVWREPVARQRPQIL